VPKPDFWKNTKRYYDLKSYWRNRFGCTVHKLQIDAGFTCPNRDGRLATGGCIYCDGRGSRLRQTGPLPAVSEQMRSGKALYRDLRGAARFVAYFQTFTNTYAPVDRLKLLYDEALAQEDVIGLSVGTRPDCVPDEVLDLLASYAGARHIWLELGLQSISARTLRLINRGHGPEVFLDAVQRAAARGLLVCVHLILGLPGETREDVLETARVVSELPIRGVKLHCLLALRGIRLGEMYERGEVRLWEREEYAAAACDVLERLSPEVVIQRLTADGYRDIYLAPEWARNKLAVLNAIDGEMTRRDSWQGRLWKPGTGEMKQ